MKLLEGKTGRIVLFSYLGAVTALEGLAAWQRGIWSLAASRVWLVTGIALLALLVVYAARTAWEDIKNRRFPELFGFAVLLMFFCFFIGNIHFSDVSPDAATQLSEGLAAIKEPDLRYFGTAFLGYSCRQYVLGALPTLLFGRTIFALQLGFAWPFIAGLTLLYLELRKYLARIGSAEKLALLPVYALLTFPYIAEYYRNFEQAITPVALEMLAIGLFLRFLRTRDALTVCALSYVGGLLANAYTPAFAVLGLLFAFLLGYALGLVRPPKPWRSKKVPSSNESLRSVQDGGAAASGEGAASPEDGRAAASEAAASGEKAAASGEEFPGRPGLWDRLAALALLANLAVFFIAAFLLNKTTEFAIRETDEGVGISAGRAFGIWGEFFTNKNGLFFGVTGLAALLFLLASLFFWRWLCGLVIFVWILGVSVFAELLGGYANYTKAWILQRDMIIVPVLVTAAFLAMVRAGKRWGRTLAKADATAAICLLLTAFLISGAYNFSKRHASFRYFGYVNTVRYAISYIGDTIRGLGIPSEGEFTVVMRAENALMANIWDYGKYFFPNADCRSYNEETETEAYDTLREGGLTKPVIWLSQEELPRDEGFARQGHLTWWDGVYQCEVTWHRGIIE